MKPTVVVDVKDSKVNPVQEKNEPIVVEKVVTPPKIHFNGEEDLEDFDINDFDFFDWPKINLSLYAIFPLQQIQVKMIN